MTVRERSHEPIFWSLFGAGGVVAALLAPALVFLTGFGVPLGVLTPEVLDYGRIRSLLDNGVFSVCAFGVISLLLWHSMHRISHSLHDLGIDAGTTGKVVCYGIAMAGTLAAGTLLLVVR